MSMGVVREFPLRGFVVSQSIVWVVVSRAWIVIVRAVILSLTNCVLEAFTYVSGKIVRSRSKVVLVGERTIVSIWIV